MTSDLFHSFQILSELGVQSVGDQLTPGAFSDISLSVQVPFGNVIVYNETLTAANLPVGLAMISLIFSTSCSVNSPALQKSVKHTERGGKATVPLVEIDLGNLKNEVGESSSNTSDDSEGEHDLAFTFDVCVLDSQNVSELVCLSQHDR